MEELEPDAVALARAIAVLGTGAELAHARRLAALEADAAARACDVLVRAEVLRAGRPLTFADPVLEEQLHDSLGEAERSQAHAEAARVLRAAGEAPERIALHLLMAEPDGQADAVATLRDAAEVARARGAHGTAAQYLRRALAEPPRPYVRPVLEAELSEAELAIRGGGPRGQSSAARAPRLQARRELLSTSAPARDGEEALLLADVALETLRDASLPSNVVAELARRSLAADPLPPRALLDSHRVLVCCGQFADADAALDRWGEVLAEHDARLAHGQSMLRQGRVDEALEALRGTSAADLGICYLERDELEQALATLAESAGDDPAELHRVSGVVRAATGELEEAIAELELSGRRSGAVNPAYAGWRAAASEVALRLGQVDRARVLATEELELARPFAALPAVGVALRASGLATSGADARRWFEESIAVLRESGAKLELARALVELGGLLRRTGDRGDAREPLREAHDLADRGGARRVAARAEEELLATGARRPKRSLSGADSLTPSERRVAELAAEGLSNREIAQALFVTVRTVTTHLTHTYQKLDIARREELGASLGAGRAPPTAPVRAAGSRDMEDREPVEQSSGGELEPAEEPVTVPPVTSLHAARAALAAGAPGAVIEYCSDALRMPADQLAYARTATLLGQALYHGGRFMEAEEAVTGAIDQVGDEAPPAILAELEAVRACTAIVCDRFLEQLGDRIPRLRLLAVAAGAAGRALTVVDAAWRWCRGELAEDLLELLSRGLAGDRLVEEQASDNPAVPLALTALVFMDETAWATALISAVTADASRRGSVLARAYACGFAALLALRSGELATAERDSRSALALCARHGIGLVEEMFAGCRAEALITRGELEEAEAVLGRMPAGEPVGTVARAYAMFARGRLRLAQGRVEEAVSDLRACGAMSRGLATDNPNVAPWRSTLALALARVGGGIDGSRSLIDEELALAWRYRQPRAIGVALAARARFEEGVQRIATLREAAARLGRSPALVERARTLEQLGIALLDDGRPGEGRDVLREALSIALRGGATALAASAAEALADPRITASD